MHSLAATRLNAARGLQCVASKAPRDITQMHGMPQAADPKIVVTERCYRYWASAPLDTGNSKTTSLPVSFLYTAPYVSSLYSTELRSFGSKYTCRATRYAAF